jgi:hypothetical protein
MWSKVAASTPPSFKLSEFLDIVVPSADLPATATSADPPANASTTVVVGFLRLSLLSFHRSGVTELPGTSRQIKRKMFTPTNVAMKVLMQMPKDPMAEQARRLGVSTGGGDSGAM